MSCNRNRLVRRPRLGLAAAVLAMLLAVQTAAAFPPEGEEAYAVWARTDLPVAEGSVNRTWMWGPEAITPGLPEPYSESPGGTRAVQYFDKSRMEVTHPDNDPSSDWYITNGLLVLELVTGRMQVGDADFDQREPAQVNVAGDPDDLDAITYAGLADILNQPARGAGELIDDILLWRDGTLTWGETPSNGVTAAHYVPETGHTVATPFWEFMNSTGEVYQAGQFTQAALFPNAFYATGFPITEANWALVKVAGEFQHVLIQCFERRCLTYTPGNPIGWQVEAGNVGQHYYQWRYHSEPEPAPPPPDGQVVLTGAVDAIEISAGETHGDVTYGVDFVGRVDGDFDAFVEFTIDYTPPEPAPSVVHTIVGGSWSIEQDDGTLSGTFAGGTAAWDDTESNAAVTGELLVTDATGVFAGLGGAGSFTGTLSHRTFPPSLDGTLELTLE